MDGLVVRRRRDGVVFRGDISVSEIDVWPSQYFDNWTSVKVTTDHWIILCSTH